MGRHRGLLVVAAVLPLAGCFQSSTLIKVKADGSGTIEQRTLITEAALDQLRAFTILGGGKTSDIDPVSETQARSLAAAIGPGVVYVSSTPAKTSDAQGRDAVYAFTDITKLRISEQPQAPGGVTLRAPGLGTDTPPITFALAQQPDGNVLLRILVPRPGMLPFAAPDANGTVTPPSLDQIAMAKQLLAGAHLTVAVETAGHVSRSSSPYVDGNRVTLIDVDIDQAAKDPALPGKLQAARTLDDVKAAVSGTAGLKINLDPEISIEFTPEK